MTDLARIMQTIRKVLYCPDGQPPQPADAARDASIAKQWLQRDSVERILTAIEGFGKMRDTGQLAHWIAPKDKATLRALNLPINGGIRFFERCIAEGLKAGPSKRGATMNSLGTILNEAARRANG